MEPQFGGGLIEKRSIDYIPIAERHGKVWHLWPVWFSGDAHLATIATGVVGVALGGNLVWMVIAVVLGSALGTFFMAFHSTQGPQLGLPQMIQSRPQFGYVGALLVWGVALIAYIGFNAFNQILAAQTLAFAVRRRDHADARDIRAAVGVARRARLRLIHIAQRWIAYVLIVALLIFTVAVLIKIQLPVQQLAWSEFRAVPFLAQFFAAASYQCRLVDLCVGLFTLPAAQRGRGRLILVDLPRSVHRRVLDHAGRHRGGSRFVSRALSSPTRCVPRRTP
jgi:NCS1 family nucleobase:cation symporter-1